MNILNEDCDTCKTIVGSIDTLHEKILNLERSVMRASIIILTKNGEIKGLKNRVKDLETNQ